MKALWLEMEKELAKPRDDERLEQRTSAFGLWRDAKAYIDAALAVQLPAESPQDDLEQQYSKPAYFLASHSIELSLKAFLRAKGMPVRDLSSSSRYGHNLWSLVREARRRKLGRVVRLTEADREAILLLSLSYKPKELEYFVRGCRTLPKYHVLVALAKKFVEGRDLKNYCVRAT